jgi:hypothetical protein
MTTDKIEKLISALKIADYVKKTFGLSFSTSAFNMWRRKKTGPNFIRVGGTKVFYKESDVLKWRIDLEKQKNVKPKGKKNGSSERQRAERK